MKIGESSDCNDGVSTHKLSYKKVYIERVYCSLTDILLSEIKSKFINFAMLAAMIFSFI